MKLSLNIKSTICYLTLLMGVMQASLRFSDSGLSVIFRWCAPPLVLFILSHKYIFYKRELLWMVLLYIYSFAVSFIFYNHINWKIHFFLIFIFMDYVIVKYLYLTDENWELNFFKFLDITTMGLVGLSIFQYLTGFVFPHIPLRRHGLPTVFWNENEVSAAIMCVGIIYLYRAFFYNKSYLIRSIIVFSVAYYNDAKLSMIGFLMAFFILCTYKIFTYKFNGCKISVRVIIGLSSLLIVSAYMFFSIMNYEFHFREHSYSFDVLIGNVVRALVYLEPLNAVGSINMRANAIIYGIKELKDTFFCGIGFGNSIIMLAQDQYKMKGIMSMHNLIAEFIIEMGFIGIYWIGKVYMKAISGISFGKVGPKDYLFFVFMIGFIFISSQSSGAILSNYMIWSVLFYVLLIGGERVRRVEDWKVFDDGSE